MPCSAWQTVRWVWRGLYDRGMARGEQSVRVGVLDNDPLALQMVTGLLRHQEHVDVVWVERAPAMAIQACLSVRSRPDVLVVDMALEGITGIDVCRRVRQVVEAVRVIGITAYRPEAYREDALAAGMQAVLSKTQIQDLLTQIRDTNTILQDTRHQDINTTTGTEPPAKNIQGLSPRELETLRGFAQGLESREIMEHMGVGKSTLASYEHRAMEKLGARTRSEAVARCASMHLFG